MGQLMISMANSAKKWGISTRVAWWLAWLPILVAAAVLATYVSRPLYRFVTMEDGPVEWLQFVFYAATAVVSAGIAIKRWKAGHPWQALLFVGFALANFFVAGEEIAWGQRLFGLQTPEELKEINAQGEITVHNIGYIQDIFNFVMFLASAYGISAYFLDKKVPVERFGDQSSYLLVPPLFLIPTFLVTFAYKLIRYTVVRSPDFTVTKYAEVAELTLAFGFFMFVWLNYRRLKVEQVAKVQVPDTALPSKAKV